LIRAPKFIHFGADVREHVLVDFFASFREPVGFLTLVAVGAEE